MSEAPPEAPAPETPTDTTRRFRIPVGVVEGYMTSDARLIEPGALVARPVPLTLQSMRQNAPGHDGALVSGTIDRVERVDGASLTDPITGAPYGPGVYVWAAYGEFTDTEDGLYFRDRVADGSLRFISVDVAGAESELEVTEVDDDGWPVDGYERVTRGELAGFTQVGHPAFPGAYIELDVDEPAGPPPGLVPTAEQAATGVQVLNDGPGCEPCRSDPAAAVVAAGGPLHPPAAWFADPGFSPDDGRLVEQSSGAWAAPLTITDDGQVYGHVAAWGTCHIGVAGSCLTPQRSPSGYALFRVGAVRTAEGQDVPVGHLTYNTGHAPLRDGDTGEWVGAGDALAHYDHTGTVWADVAAGEDDYGIWVAGALRPGVTDSALRDLRSASLSGDWRRHGSGLEMVAALAVNTPGYPIERARAVAAAGVPQALVASGALPRSARPGPAPARPPAADLIGAAIERALRPVYASTAAAALSRIPRSPR